jgi:hypothetical protein
MGLCPGRMGEQHSKSATSPQTPKKQMKGEALQNNLPRPAGMGVGGWGNDGRGVPFYWLTFYWLRRSQKAVYNCSGTESANNRQHIYLDYMQKWGTLMPDMLVKLYDLPPAPSTEALQAEGIDIRRAMAPAKHATVEWVRSKFKDGWASECDVAFSRQPISCFIAVKDNKIIGFACHEATCKGFFGPTGVDEAWRERGIGTHLLFACLQDMRNAGYAYAVIGSAGPADFYRKVVGAAPIEGSSPGIYKDMLRNT